MEQAMKMILFILNDACKIQDLLDAWQEAGVSGVTVLFSTGIGRLHQARHLREDLPIMPSLSDFYQREESLSRTIFTIIKDDTLVEKVRLATRRVIGDLNQPDTGLFIILPVEQAEGLEKSRKNPSEK
jgi:nitrogen regulatory protein P-II 1